MDFVVYTLHMIISHKAINFQVILAPNPAVMYMDQSC